jgi:hypothetical protein
MNLSYKSDYRNAFFILLIRIRSLILLIMIFLCRLLNVRVLKQQGLFPLTFEIGLIISKLICLFSNIFTLTIVRSMKSNTLSIEMNKNEDGRHYYFLSWTKKRKISLIPRSNVIEQITNVSFQH